MWNWHYAQSMEDSAGRNSKHIYLGDTRIVTKIAKANANLNTSTQEETAKQYYYHSDHLGSAQLISDAQGREYERLEYTPYGEIWIDKSQAASEIDVPFRFTGKERDVETGLYYYGARYLDSKTSRWLSADPALGEYIPQAPVNDEAKKHNQSLPGQGGIFNTVNAHLYHYAGNNPVKFTDPDGRTTYVFSIFVTPKDRHLFIAVQDKKGNITTRSLYPKSQAKAIADVFTGGTQENILKKDKPDELEIAKKNLNSDQKDSKIEQILENTLPVPKMEAEIKTPEGMSEEEFDQKVIENADNYPINNRPYNATRGPNSNTYVDDVIEKSGGIMPDIKNATQQNWGE
jgi:RHS repeat-associated protein